MPNWINPQVDLGNILTLVVIICACASKFAKFSATVTQLAEIVERLERQVTALAVRVENRTELGNERYRELVERLARLEGRT